jgi:hypothetical protein
MPRNQSILLRVASKGLPVFQFVIRAANLVLTQRTLSIFYIDFLGVRVHLIRSVLIVSVLQCVQLRRKLRNAADLA